MQASRLGFSGLISRTAASSLAQPSPAQDGCTGRKSFCGRRRRLPAFRSSRMTTKLRPRALPGAASLFSTEGQAAWAARCNPARMPAGSLVRGRQGCGLAAMAAVGIQLGSADEGSPPGFGRGSASPLLLVEQDANSTLVKTLEKEGEINSDLHAG